MVNYTVFRRVSRRSVLAVLASIASVGLSADAATAQAQSPAIPIGGPVPEFNLSDIPLAEGETIVSSQTSDGGPTIEYGGSSYKMVTPGTVPMAADTTGHQSPFLAEPYAGGGSCASGNCRSGSCGTPGCRNSRFGHPTDLGGRARMGSGGNVCGPTCDPYSYASVEGLYMKNDSLDSFGVPAPFNLSDFDYELGARVTFGRVPDCHNGYEFSFVGPFNWEASSVRNTPGINANVVAGNPIAPAQLTSFLNADSASQFLEADYFSFEANRTKIGWDVIKLLYGIRYIQYDEDYLYLSTAQGGGTTGVLRSAVENRMVGGQLGIDMNFPMTCRLWSDFRGRAGVFGNFAENRFQLSNDATSTPDIFNEDDAVELAGMLEISGGFRYYFTNNFHIRGGGEMWYITEIAKATGQFGAVMAPGTAGNIAVDDDMFLFGLSVGGEFKF
jgi:hypothetical protein